MDTVVANGVTVITGLSKALLNFTNFLRNYNHSASALRAVVLKTQSLFSQIERQQYVSKGLQSPSFRTVYLAAKLQAEMYELTVYLKGVQAVDKIQDQEKRKSAMKEIGNDIDSYTEHITELCEQVFETCNLLVERLDMMKLEKKIRKALKKKELRDKQAAPQKGETQRGFDVHRGESDPLKMTPNAVKKKDEDDKKRAEEKQKRKSEREQSRKEQYQKLDSKWKDELIRDLNSFEWANKEEVQPISKEMREKQREIKKEIKKQRATRIKKSISNFLFSH